MTDRAIDVKPNLASRRRSGRPSPGEHDDRERVRGAVGDLVGDRRGPPRGPPGGAGERIPYTPLSRSISQVGAAAGDRHRASTTTANACAAQSATLSAIAAGHGGAAV